jgi:Protein of unknown function (DUF3489)
MMADSDIEIVQKTCEGYAPQAPNNKSATKSDQLLKLLRSKRGATIDRLQSASGWQAHSVRGFLSGTVKNKLGLKLVVETSDNGTRRYRISKRGRWAADHAAPSILTIPMLPLAGPLLLVPSEGATEQTKFLSLAR